MLEGCVGAEWMLGNAWYRCGQDMLAELDRFGPPVDDDGPV